MPVGDSEDKEDISRKTKLEKKRGELSRERVPLMLEFSTLFESLEVIRFVRPVCFCNFPFQLSDSKKVVAGGSVALHQHSQPSKLTALDHSSQRTGNALDSSAPTIRRGKERETPKKRKPSALRKV